uniref:BEACH-type PH domain-containing protein n=1 Tax=Amphimedon queenslandica TaxID=400682 RepID=A0A1X7TEY4_AMPQE
KERRLVFSLNYGNIDAVLAKIVMIENIVQSRQNEVSFNTSWLENLYEEIILETQGDRITPLVSNPGRIMLTSSRIYFQPFNNVEV